MISPEDIRLQALKWWQSYLLSLILKKPFFPREMDRIGKVKPGDLTHRFDVLQDEVAMLYKHSKNETGTGYWIKTAEKNFRRTGAHQLPDNILFETAEDYLCYIRKKGEAALFIQNYERLVGALPQLRTWTLKNPMPLTERDTDWEGILAVCQYFIDTPRSNLYLRQLPIPVHTKFIEENDTVLQSLLDFLIPGDIRDSNQKKFAERYFLQKDEPLIRLRMLYGHFFISHKLSDCSFCLSDISIRLSDFEKFDAPYDNVLITENKMNFLTLPKLTSAIAIWSGGGFKVSYLRNARWLQGKNIWYWGDIDEHGFQILHQLRTYFGQTRSIMMDRATFDKFQVFAVAGERNKAELLSLLTREESALYEHLKNQPTHNRLEQEKISQDYANAAFLAIAPTQPS
jgi:hypothetical protein